jgi:hypothetical protein
MTAPDAEDISRTTLLVMNSASSLEEAEAILAAEQIVIVAGPECATSMPHQAALLTAANTARRAVGNVPVVTHPDVRKATVLAGPLKGLTLAEALDRINAAQVEVIDRAGPTIVIGTADARGAARVTWAGWTAAVRTDAECRLSEDEDMSLAPIAAAALAVSEAFQHLRGHREAGRRDVTLSLWDPLAPDPMAAQGPRVEWLPSEWALLGLGHLGQANAWGISFLPYNEAAGVRVRLQDVDHVTKATLSTGLLTFDGDLDKMKTRVVAAALEHAGFATAVVEQRLVAGDRAHDYEQLALIGVDNITTRRLLSGVGWKLCVDAGLGRGVNNYTSIRLQAFPGPQRSDEVPAWREQRPAVTAVPDAAAYNALRAAGVDECGLITIANKAVAVTFVGTIAACLAIAEPLRALHNGPVLGVQTIDLSSPKHFRGDARETRAGPPPPAIARLASASCIRTRPWNTAKRQSPRHGSPRV